MRKGLISMFLISFLLGFTACSSKDIKEKTRNNNIKVSAEDKTISNNEKFETIVSETSMSDRYVHFDNLLSDSDIVIEGEVINISYFDFNTIPRTKSHVKVLKSYNNIVKEGDILTFIESGGITTKSKMMEYSGEKDKTGIIPTEQDKNTKVKYSVGGSETMQPKEKTLIFGVQEKDDFYKLSEKYYIVLGAFMGKFNIKGNKIQRFMPEKTKNDTDFNTLENITDYRKSLETHLKKKY